MNWNLMILGSLRNLRRFKLRSLMMSIGIALGVATLITGSAIGTGAEKRLADQIDQMFGPGTILLMSRQLKQEDLDAIEDAMEQVIASSSRLLLGEQEVRFQGKNYQAAIGGYGKNSEYVWNRSVTEGRFFDSSDINRASRVALIGSSLKHELFGENDAIGMEIMISSDPYELIGILEPIGIDPHGEDRDRDIYVPISTAMRRLANVDIIGSAKLVVSNAERVDEDAEQVAAILRQQHQIADLEEETFRIYTSKFAGKAAIKAKRVITSYVLIGAALVLLVALVLIASIMLTVVGERVAEIGLRKAIGATPRLIAAQFLFEATSVSLLAGMVGVILGIVISLGISEQFDIPLDLRPLAIGFALLVSILVGVLAGILPARRAARLNAVEALS